MINLVMEMKRKREKKQAFFCFLLDLLICPTLRPTRLPLSPASLPQIPLSFLFVLEEECQGGLAAGSLCGEKESQKARLVIESTTTHPSAPLSTHSGEAEPYLRPCAA